MEVISIVILIILMLCFLTMTLVFINILLSFQKIAVYKYHFAPLSKVHNNDECKEIQNRKSTIKLLLKNFILDNHILFNLFLGNKKEKLSQNLFRLSFVILLYLTLIIIVNKYDEFNFDNNGFSKMILINLIAIVLSLNIFKVLTKLFQNRIKEINIVNNLFLDIFFLSFAVLIVVLSILAVFSTILSENGNPIFVAMFFIAVFLDVLVFRLFGSLFFFFIENAIFKKTDQELFEEYLFLLEEELFLEKVSLNKELSPEIDLEMNNKSERLLLIKNEEKSFSMSHLSKRNNSFIFEIKKKFKNNQVHNNEEDDLANKNQEEDILSDKEGDLGQEEIDQTGLQFFPKNQNHNTPLILGFEKYKSNSGETLNEDSLKDQKSLNSKCNEEINQTKEIIKHRDLNKTSQIGSKFDHNLFPQNKLISPNKLKYHSNIAIAEKKKNRTAKGENFFNKSCIIPEEKLNLNKTASRRSQSAISTFNLKKEFQSSENILKKIESLLNNKIQFNNEDNKINIQKKSQDSGESQTISSKNTSEGDSQNRKILNSQFTKFTNEIKESNKSMLSIKDKNNSPKKKFVSKTGKTKKNSNDENEITQKVLSINEISLDKSSINNSSMKDSKEKNENSNKTVLGRKDNLLRSLSRDRNKNNSDLRIPKYQMIKNNILNREYSLNHLNEEKIGPTEKNVANPNKIRQGRFINRRNTTFLNDIKQEIMISGNIENIKKKS